MICLYIGRFQPFHKGHLFDVQNALSFSDSVTIGIGSAQEKNTKDNPFSFEERKKMIEGVLEKEGITSFRVVGIEDINNNDEWVDHVTGIVGSFDVVYTGNPLVKQLFSKKGVDVKDVEFLGDINATSIRENIVNGEEWQSLVPKETIDFLERIGGIEKIKSLGS